MKKRKRRNSEPTRFTIRFFMDRETGTVFEAKVAVAPQNEGSILWVECDCDAYIDDNYCVHSDAIHDDYDDLGNFYVALDDEVEGADEAAKRVQRAFKTPEDAKELRDILLRFGLIEVI